MLAPIEEMFDVVKSHKLFCSKFICEFTSDSAEQPPITRKTSDEPRIVHTLLPDIRNEEFRAANAEESGFDMQVVWRTHPDQTQKLEP